MRNRLLIALLGCITLITSAQSTNKRVEPIPKDIEIYFSILLDNKVIESDSIFVYVGGQMPSKEPFKLTNSFTTWLEPNRVYTFIIEHPRYQRQLFHIDTRNGSGKINYNVHLIRGEPDCYNGYTVYDNKQKKYVSL